MFRTLVVGIDGSQPSEKALRIACDLATLYDGTVHLVHTPQPQTVAFAAGAVAGYHVVTSMPPDDQVQDAARKILQKGVEIAEECGQQDVQTHTSRGNPVTEITAYADSCGADLIVTGRRGLGNIGGLVLGSTSQGIGHKASCAVLTVA